MNALVTGVLGSAHLALIAVLLPAAATKARDLRRFASDIAGYRLLPTRLTTPAALLLIAAELAASALLTLPATRRTGALLAGLLFAAFLTAMATVSYRGLRTACGCFGGSDAVGPRTLLRTGLLLALAAAATAGGAAPFTAAQLLYAPLLLAAALLPPLLVRPAPPPPPGPRPGDRFTVADPAQPRPRPTLYALVSPGCGLCSAMLPAFAAASARLDVVLVSAAHPDDVRAYLDDHDIHLPHLTDPHVFDANAIPWPPYAVLAGPGATVLAAGGTSSPEQLALLLDQAPTPH
uniref:MauE/DoxX family redox-associated membrane protein n=1 Tax=Nonomuraea pusilla TaxID=46177 RepID=UPI0006E2809A|nr:MauE/DoxX family redox-associated membrane protein [Nonomuraea pusilla]